MDEQRFDDLARKLGGGRSRRGLLRGLAGALGLTLFGSRIQEGAAQYGSLGPGDPCYDDGQCSALVMNYSPLFCADNGFDYDGPLNCCTYEEGFCFSDEGCCGNLVCDVDQRCRSTSSYLGPGELCNSSLECNESVTGLSCDYEGPTNDYRCCRYDGAFCSADVECCGWNVCGPDGTCTAQRNITCSSYGCGCDPNDPYACNPGLGCCGVQGGFACGTADECGFVPCTGQGCPCTDGMPGNCDVGLECCVQGDVGAGGLCGPIGQCYSALAGNCTGYGCTCLVQDPYSCDPGLFCCGPGGRGATGTCVPPGGC